MTSVAKLKERARKYEQKEDWKAAIEAYRKALDSEDNADVELALYNRVGDLYLRLGQTDEAVSYYETAADKYAELGFYNNAIALCNKALRHRPDRAHVYLKLSRLSADQGFLPDARRWVLKYSERQVKSGNMEAAFTGLEEFADMSDDPDVREVLARHLAAHDRSADAVEQLRRAYSTWTAQGDDAAAERVAKQARSLDPNVDLVAGSGAAPRPRTGSVDSFGDALLTYEPVPGGVAGLESHRAGEDAGAGETAVKPGSERSRVEPAPMRDESAMSGLETFEAETGAETSPVPDVEPEEDLDEPEPLPLLDTGLDEEPQDEPEPLPFPGTRAEKEARAKEIEAKETDAEETEPESEVPEPEADLPPDLELDAAFASGFDGLPPLDLDADAGAAPDGARPSLIEPLDIGSLDLGAMDLGGGAASAMEPERPAEVDVQAVIGRARELVSRGLAAEALRELQLLSDPGIEGDVILSALQVVMEVIRHDPNDVTALQHRVELASRLGDRGVVLDAFLDLGDALARLGAETKARAMYERVLGLDPGNEAAREALGLAGEAMEEEAVDLDAVLRELEPTGDGAASSDESPAGRDASADSGFAAMLSQFRARVTDRTTEDAGDHYDLGLAFMEMGLVDEAIGEFQTALTAGEERLKVYEELGQCFMLKGQYNVALEIFSRALQVPSRDDSELLGVYFHLGECHEELGQRAEARKAYGKVLEIDDTFGDVPDRLARL